MARLLFSDSFVEDLSRVQSQRVYRRIVSLVSYLESMPEMGSPDIPAAARRRYGNGARKLVASPFDVLYVYDAEHDEVHVDGLVHQRAL